MVRLFEYQGKQLLRKVGISVPDGELATTVREAAQIAEKVGPPVVVKAQVLATGRFKAGGIMFAESCAEAVEAARKVFTKEITGFKTEKVLVEEKLDIEKEFFMSVTVSDSYKVKAPVILFSTKGGVDIEEVAEKHPEEISRVNVDFLRGVQLSDGRKLVARLQVLPAIVDELADIACRLYDVFRNCNASTVETNPLVLTKDGRIVAADCRITLDDNSVFRHPEFNIDLPRDMTRPATELEKIAWNIEERDYRGTCYFIQLSSIEEIKKGGYIAFHGIGGGASMLAADALMLRNFKLASYADTSGNPTASKVYRAIKVLMALPRLEGYFLGGAVFANQEQWYHAFAIAKALREEAGRRPNFPVLILIAGNKESETHDIIRNALESIPLRWELYGREHIYDLNFLADRMKMMIEEHRRERRDQRQEIKDARSWCKTRKENSQGKHLEFESQTGKVNIDLTKCVAPDCGFACIKADRWYGRSCLKIENNKPALARNPEDLKRFCNECLACEIECELRGGKAIRVELPLYGIDEFRKEHGARAMRM